MTTATTTTTTKLFLNELVSLTKKSNVEVIRTIRRICRFYVTCVVFVLGVGVGAAVL